ncbi:MAG: DUF4390 domain-containing protein [Thiogranum sp.]|nr:DUF4390 domain-containing protein [Thiogranum sp.]
MSARRDCRGARQWYFPLLLALCFVSAQPCVADGKNRPTDTTIRDARTILVDGVYRVGAIIDFKLNETLSEGLQNGVPLVLELRIEVIRERDWLWPERVAQLRQRFSLEYHALTRRYLVENESTGVQYSFATLDEALDYVGNVYDLPLIDANLLEPEQSYEVWMRADLEIESLPTPVRLWAYFGSDWTLQSDWFKWPLQP